MTPTDSTSEAGLAMQASQRLALGADGTAADSDGDGLSDFQEIHKYRTDPNRKDTAGKGIYDGRWEQRRELPTASRRNPRDAAL